MGRLVVAVVDTAAGPGSAVADKAAAQGLAAVEAVEAVVAVRAAEAVVPAADQRIAGAVVAVPEGRPELALGWQPESVAQIERPHS